MLEDWSQWADALTFVPASPEALLRRGFDHMERVAQRVAERTGLPLVRTLACKRGVLDQRELGRAERRANRRKSFEISNTCDTCTMPRRVVLIDDVFTTGATLCAATEVLLDAGVKEVRVIACARVW